MVVRWRLAQDAATAAGQHTKPDIDGHCLAIGPRNGVIACVARETTDDNFTMPQLWRKYPQ